MHTTFMIREIFSFFVEELLLPERNLPPGCILKWPKCGMAGHGHGHGMDTAFSVDQSINSDLTALCPPSALSSDLQTASRVHPEDHLVSPPTR